MKALECCVHLTFRQGIISLPKDMRKEGHGDCFKCIYDSKQNSKCLGYVAVKIYHIGVEEAKTPRQKIRKSFYNLISRFYKSKKIAVIK